METILAAGVRVSTLGPIIVIMVRTAAAHSLRAPCTKKRRGGGHSKCRLACGPVECKQILETFSPLTLLSTSLLPAMALATVNCSRRRMISLDWGEGTKEEVW